MHLHKPMHHFHLKHKPHKVDEKTRSEILNLPIWKLFKKLAIPAIFGMLMYAIYIFVDAIFVGQWVGPEGIAAISIVYPLTLINSAIAAFSGIGFSSVLSRAIGAKDEKTLKKILGNNTILILIFSIIYTVIGLFFAENMVGALGATGTILTYGTSYFRIVVFGSFFINFIGSTIMLTLAEGKTKAAMSIILAGSMLNIILDPIFIKVLDLGIEGAAIATVIAMVVTTIIALVYFIIGDSELYFNKSGFHLDSKLLHEMAPVGASGMAMQLMLVIEQVIIFKSVSIYGGGSELVIIGATLNMLNFALIPMWGISSGLQPVIGMNLGAKKYDRVKEGFKKFVLAATGIALVIWALFMLFPQSVLSMYITDSKLASSGAPAFRIVMSMFFLHAMILLSATLFQAIGKGGMATFLLIARQVIIFAPIVIILPIFMGLDGIWISIPIADIIILVMTLIFVYREFNMLGKNQTKNLKKNKVEMHAMS